MTTPTVFREFAEKIRTILSSRTPETVLMAIRALAEGSAATLDDGTIVLPLSDLCPHPEPIDSISLLLYQETMTSLLRWGLQVFPQQPTYREPNLWRSMAILDGPRGYNQRLVDTEDTWLDMMTQRREPLPEEVVCDPDMLPMLPSMTRGPVRPLDDDLTYIENLLRRDRTVHTVLATRCPFGWKRLWIECVCLHVSADETAALLAVLPDQDTPTIVLNAQIREMAGPAADAEDILGLAGLESWEASQRSFVLRKNLMLRPPQHPGRLSHGQSISLQKEESKGSVGVFLAPTSNNDDGEKYALTAYHVLPYLEKKQTQVITPGGLDILSELFKTVSEADSQSRARLLSAWVEPCGTVVHGDIGVNSQGWRSDLALVRLADGWECHNGRWFNSRGTDVMTELLSVTKESPRPPATFNLHHIVGPADPDAGAIVYKDGARTGCSAGRVGPFESKMFRARTADSSDMSDPTVMVARLLTLYPLSEATEPVCGTGDSGAGVFMPCYAMGGWQWAGQLVSLGLVRNQTIGLFVPSSAVLLSLREITEREWRLV
ncbi:hypothetical protein DTO002I6_3335 [Penicillium roqueforti]|nr:hypothetical protein DTO002I6_3335 [Penicillium roqueforti]